MGTHSWRMVDGNAAGAIISVVASILSNIGTDIQKEAHIRNDALPKDKQTSYVKQPLWWFGLSGVVVGSIGDFVAFSLASQELVVAVGCAAVLTCNIVVSIFWHHEQMGWTDVIGIICVLTGAVVFAVVAPASQDYTASELASKFERTPFLILLICQCAGMVILISMISTSRVYALRIKCQYRCFRHLFTRYDQLEQQNAEMLERICLMEEKWKSQEDELDTEARKLSTLTESVVNTIHQNVAEGSAWESEDAQIQKSDIIDKDDKADGKAWDSYIYAACSGTAGGMMALFAGCASKSLKQTFDGDNQFDSAWTYVFLLGLVLFILMQTHFLNRAMMLGDLMSVIPTFQAFWIVFGVFSGMAFYGHDEGMSFTGLLLMIVGVAFLLQHPRILDGEDVMGAKQKLSCVAEGCGCEPSICGLTKEGKDKEKLQDDDVEMADGDANSPSSPNVAASGEDKNSKPFFRGQPGVKADQVASQEAV